MSAGRRPGDSTVQNTSWTDCYLALEHVEYEVHQGAQPEPALVQLVVEKELMYLALRP
jgi:hypothetical protein